MGKHKKKKHQKKKARDDDSKDPEKAKPSPDDETSPGATHAKAKSSTQHTGDSNPLLRAQSKFLSSLSPTVRRHFFSPKHVDADTRADVWSRQAELGEDLVNEHAWATPDRRALSIIRHFAPIVEIGCGANAYWARMMHKAGIDVVAFDAAVKDGGKIHGSADKSEKKKRKRGDKEGRSESFSVRKGGPEVLSSGPIGKSGRALFLCYPDEDDGLVANTDVKNPFSMGAACLEHFQGETVIHVGELHGDTPSLDQAPWGRSSSPEFQSRLAAEYHCLLKASLPSWLHVRDTISVWKRTEMCSIVFRGEDEDESDEEAEYKNVPPDEILPVNVAAPCVAYLLK